MDTEQSPVRCVSGVTRCAAALVCAAIGFGGPACSDSKRDESQTESPQAKKSDDGKKDKKKRAKSPKRNSEPKVEADFEEMAAKTINEDNYKDVLDELDEQIRVEQEVALALLDKLEAEAAEAKTKKDDKKKKKRKDGDALTAKSKGDEKAAGNKPAAVKKSALKPAASTKAPAPGAVAQ